MNNLEFFTTCFENEVAGTVAAFNSLPPDNLFYKPHEKNKSAREQMEHIMGHLFILKSILKRYECEEVPVKNFSNNYDAAILFEEGAKQVSETLMNYDESKWLNENVDLQEGGKTVLSLPRFRMMWMFLFDIIHHRGQLSSYIRAMGGKNPAIYGASADSASPSK